MCFFILDKPPLKQGDILLNKAGEKFNLDKIEMRLERSQVFNFEVGGVHNYYITQKQVLVHNTGCPKPRPIKSMRAVRTHLEELPVSVEELISDLAPEDSASNLAKVDRRIKQYVANRKFNRTVSQNELYRGVSFGQRDLYDTLASDYSVGDSIDT